MGHLAIRLLAFVGPVAFGIFAVLHAEASCGSVTCFVVLGSQQQVSQQGQFTVNMFYNYTHQGSLLPGTDGVIPSVDTDNRQLILGEHRELNTISQSGVLDINYGVTERLGIEVTVPYLSKKHEHIDGLGEANNGNGELTQFYGSGIGDVRITTKYNVLPTLRSMLVGGFGVYLPTGNWAQKTAVAGGGGGRMEPTMQIGRGNVGLEGSLYQTYEIIPHRLNEFAFGMYRHTFRNNFGYQFGDSYDFNAGLNLVTVPWLILSAQINYRYVVHDSFSGSLAIARQPGDPLFGSEPIILDPNITNRPVPTTGSTYLAVTPGVMVRLRENTQAYMFPQFPLVRDFNGNLAQGFSFIVGLTQTFEGPKLFR